MSLGPCQCKGCDEGKGRLSLENLLIAVGGCWVLLVLLAHICTWLGL